jgi:hypothetical protein
VKGKTCFYDLSLIFFIFLFYDHWPVMPPANPEKKIFGFSRTIFSLGLVSLFTDVRSEMIYPLLPIFLTSVLGMGPAFVGPVEGVAERKPTPLREMVLHLVKSLSATPGGDFRDDLDSFWDLWVVLWFD